MHPLVTALVGRMEGLLAGLEAARDPARFFLGTYLRTTRAVGAALGRGVFEDPDWVAGWDVDFAGLYLDALEAHRRDAGSVAGPWRLAFGADPGLRPEAHVLLGMNAHINFDLPQSLVRMIPPTDFTSPSVLDRRRRDHERIDEVLASRVAEEDVALERAGGRRTTLDRALAPANRQASRLFLRESRRKVWVNTGALHAARLRGPAAYAERLADLEEASAARVRDLLRPGPVLLRLAVYGFGVTLPAS
ncbi:hypothetical protein E4P39_10800 [Blastococcus sp. CT_GayMR19]|uniref:DUF5995 family protein n=1 Tax=Blastococcus sp. CT_GayMR19 TaxID=2559608 RepID=UPI0010738C2F|nr:DUF5995 family protein [Blastococcus sp. CT_GayMR19]TFV75517.1 hypothetical protein E4P39_10800 [Blastococcus sp. CT_GayMR19]